MKKNLLTFSGIIILVIWMFPVIWLVITSLKLEKDVITETFKFFTVAPTLANYTKALTSTYVIKWLWNSSLVSVVTMLFTLVLNAPIAYAFARISFRGKTFLFWLVMAGMMIPFQVLVIPLYLQFNAYGMLNTLAAIILPRLAIPIGIFILKQFYEGIPLSLEEAAFIDGAGRFRIFIMIILPLGKAAMATVIILSFITAWNDFLWPLIVISDTARYTITVGIANFQGTHGTEYSLIMAGAFIASLPQFLFYGIFRKKIVAGVAMSGIKG